jgi:hypothetical protein
MVHISQTEAVSTFRLPSGDLAATCSYEIFMENGYFFSFKVQRNFRNNNEKGVDFSDHSRKIHKKG